MKILVDMNLSPGVCNALGQRGWESMHWSTVGDPRAPDHEIMQYAAEHEFAVLSHDLDFSAM
jgi:predicted nuclease of predicted toxin-antitoxin system